MKRIVVLLFTAVLACDQAMYDRIYKAIIIQAIKSKLKDKTTFQIRNDSIEDLRTLCHGQLSSYEKPPKN